MTKRLTKAQRTERKCMFCGVLFIPKPGSAKGMYCGRECSSHAVGIRIARSNLKYLHESHLDIITHEEHRINYEESLDKGDYGFE